MTMLVICASIALVCCVIAATLIRALCPPPKPRRAVCGMCLHEVSDTPAARCPECGRLYTVTGILTRPGITRFRGSLWQACIALSLALSAVWGGSMAYTFRILQREFDTNTLRHHEFNIATFARTGRPHHGLETDEHWLITSKGWHELDPFREIVRGRETIKLQSWDWRGYRVARKATINLAPMRIVVRDAHGRELLRTDSLGEGIRELLVPLQPRLKRQHEDVGMLIAALSTNRDGFPFDRLRQVPTFRFKTIKTRTVLPMVAGVRPNPAIRGVTGCLALIAFVWLLRRAHRQRNAAIAGEPQ